MMPEGLRIWMTDRKSDPARKQTIWNETENENDLGGMDWMCRFSVLFSL